MKVTLNLSLILQSNNEECKDYCMRCIAPLLAILLLFLQPVFAQDFSNKGREFWLVFPPHQPSGGQLANLSVYITSDLASSGKIEYGGVSQNFTVQANQTVEIVLDRNASYISSTESANFFANRNRIVTNKGIKVTVDADKPPVVVYAHMFAGFRSAASLILPTNVLGRSYYAMSWTQNPLSTATGEPARSQFSVIATEDNTSVRVQVKRNGSNFGTPFVVDLPKAGDIYQYQDSSDISGSFIESVSTAQNSCKRIGVFSGSSSLSITTPNNLALGCGTVTLTNQPSIDPLYQQSYPINSWGKKYVIVPFRGKNRLNVRVIASEDNTLVKINGATPFVLNKGEIFTDLYNVLAGVPNQPPFIFEADKPISVVQYSLTQACDNPVGDPDMIFLNPVEQSINDITVFLSPKQAISDQNITVVIKNEGNAINSFRVNGNALPPGSFIPIGTSGFSYLHQQFTVPQGTNSSIRLTSDSGFNAIAYGFGSAESYGYSAGTNIKDLNPPLRIVNEFDESGVSISATCINTNFKVTLSFAYQPEKIEVDFGSAPIGPVSNVVKNNPTPDSIYVFNGRTYYFYRFVENLKFSGQGTFPIRIKTTTTIPTNDGCSNSNEQDLASEITVFASPISNFGIESNGCTNNAIILTDSANGNGRAITKWIWDFGNGQFGSNKNIQTQYTSAGNYNIKLKAINDIGCVADTTKSIVVSSKPIPNFTIPDNTCVGNEFTFIDGSTIASGTIERWTWRLDSVTTITNTNNSSVKNRYTATGTIPIQLVLQSNTGCVSDTLTKNLFVRPLPQVGLVLPGFCLADAEAIFTDTSRIEDGTESEFKYRWNFNLNNVSPPPSILTSTDRIPKVRYDSTGQYLTSLELTSKYGCVAQAQGIFEVNGSSPNADFFVVAKDTLCSNADVIIRNTSSNEIGRVTRVDIVWDRINNIAQRLSDLSPSDNKLYNHRYPPQSALTQNYTVRLVAYSGNAAVCQDSIEQVVTINKAPQLVYEVNPGICFDATPRAITQAREIGSVPGSFVFSGNGVNAAGIINPVAAGVGTHTIQYKYIANSFCVDSIVQPITVWPSPTAKFAILETIRCEQNALSFSDSSVANFSNLVQWNWNFGDATTQSRNSAATFLKTFATAGTYPVSLRVTSDSGCISPAVVQNIRIDLLPRVTFNLPGDICLPDGRATFTSSSTIPDNSDALFQYRWNFGDPNNPNAVSTLPSPTHRYTAVGPVNVQLRVTTKDGCIDSITRVFNTIYPQPKALFAVNKNEVCIDTEELTFTDQGQSAFLPARNWFWNFGDGSSSTLNNPLYRFRDSGTFTVRYHFIDGKGCISDTASQIVTVHPYPKLDLGADMVVLEGGEKPIIPAYVFGTDLSYKWVPATYLSSDTARRPITKPLDDITYELFLTGIGGCTVSDDIFVKLLKAPIVPNAFSPNGDGIHDVWLIKYLESYPGATVDVFNRYGQTVFSSVGYPRPWDGTSNGKLLPVGTYYYVIDPKNGRKIITGSVTILR